MQWFWDQYVPDPSQRDEVTAAPLNADIDELAGLPGPPASMPGIRGWRSPAVPMS